MHVQIGQAALDRLAHVRVVVARESRMDAALQADLDGAALPGLLAAPHDLVDGHEVGAPRRFSASLPFENAQKPQRK